MLAKSKPNKLVFKKPIYFYKWKKIPNHNYSDLLNDLQILDPKGRFLWETKGYTSINVTKFLRIAICFKGILAEAEPPWIKKKYAIYTNVTQSHICMDIPIHALIHWTLATILWSKHMGVNPHLIIRRSREEIFDRPKTQPRSLRKSPSSSPDSNKVEDIKPTRV